MNIFDFKILLKLNLLKRKYYFFFNIIILIHQILKVFELLILVFNKNFYFFKLKNIL